MSRCLWLPLCWIAHHKRTKEVTDTYLLGDTLPLGWAEWICYHTYGRAR